MRDRIGAADGLVFPNGFVGFAVVGEHAAGAVGCGRAVNFGEPLFVLRDHGSVLGFCSEVGPLVGIVPHIVELLGVIGVADVAPALAADTVVALVVTRDCGAQTGRGRILELRCQAKAFEVRAGRKVSEVDQGRVDIKKLGGLEHTLATLHTRTCEDQGNFGAAIPERVFTGDFFFSEVPTVIAPDHDDGVVGETGFIERHEQTADLGVHKAGRGEVTADEVAPLVVLFDPFQARLGQVPMKRFPNGTSKKPSP